MWCNVGRLFLRFQTFQLRRTYAAVAGASIRHDRASWRHEALDGPLIVATTCTVIEGIEHTTGFCRLQLYGPLTAAVRARPSPAVAGSPAYVSYVMYGASGGRPRGFRALHAYACVPERPGRRWAVWHGVVLRSAPRCTVLTSLSSGTLTPRSRGHGVGARSTATGSVKPEPLYNQKSGERDENIRVRMGFRRGQDRRCLKGEGGGDDQRRRKFAL